MTKNVQKRWVSNGLQYNHCSKFWNAICKYGWDAFEHTILQNNLTKSEAIGLEMQLISKYRTQNDKYGYNISAGGECAYANVIHPTGKDHSKSKPVYQYSLDGKYIQQWENARCASDALNIAQTDIGAAARGLLYTAGDYIWKYEMLNNVEPYHKRIYRNKKVYQLDKNLKLINIFENVYSIDKNEFNINTVIKCCVRKCITHKNYYWCFEEDFIGFENYLSTHIKNRCNSLKKQVDQYDKNYNIINTYQSVKDAASRNQINPSTMGKYCGHGCANYGFNTTGYYWRYTDDMNGDENYV